VAGPYGAAAAINRGGVAAGPFGGVAIGGSRTVVGHGTRYVSPTYLRTQGAYVRQWHGYPTFTTAWYRGYPGAWIAPRWRVANFWVAPVWASLAVYCGITAAPIVYDYGSNVVIENNNI
jgi:hypothetical protein